MRHFEAYAAPNKWHSTESDFENIFAVSHFGGMNHE